jgi:hypothetical protein
VAACLLGMWVRIPLGAWMSLISVVCCRVEVSATGRSVLQRSPTECGASECDRAASTMRTPWPTNGRRAMEKESVNSTCPGGNHMKTQAFTAPEPTESYRNSCGCVVGGRGGGGYRKLLLVFPI